MSKLTVAKKDVEKASIARGFAESEWLVEQMSNQSDSIPAFPVSYRQGLPWALKSSLTAGDACQGVTGLNVFRTFWKTNSIDISRRLIILALV